MYKCSTCKQMLAREAFGEDSRSPRGFAYRCKTCMRAKNRKAIENPEVRERRRLQTIAWREANPDRVLALRESSKDAVRDARLKRTYNIDSEAYASMLESQDGGCAICGGLNQGGKRLAVDHDHSCCPGKTSCGCCVRGLLCDACNHSIGRMEDDVDRLQRAINYLKSCRS